MGNEVINLGRKGKLLGGKADEELFNFVRGRRIGHGRGNESTKLIQARRRSSGFEDKVILEVLGDVKCRKTQAEKAAEADIEQQAARKQQGNVETSYETKKGEG